ncbi:MAG TPA: carboxymuconolactone decarboxylase family protein [Cyclobacteriaceae bacterium]|nr:carboxymuconolactone decarboxylase family protein [Cyclobacteriaceae bacterium]
MENNQLYPKATREIAEKKAALAPDSIEAWRNFSKIVFKDGVLPEKTKHLLPWQWLMLRQCPYCIRSHTAQAIKKGADKEEIMEAIWVATEMRAGAAYAHASIAIDEMENAK